MAALQGCAPHGRCHTAKVPHGRWKTVTFLAALCRDRVSTPRFSNGRSMEPASVSTRRSSFSQCFSGCFRWSSWTCSLPLHSEQAAEAAG
jgi:hypothetical protein